MKGYLALTGVILSSGSSSHLGRNGNSQFSSPIFTFSVLSGEQMLPGNELFPHQTDGGLDSIKLSKQIATKACKYFGDYFLPNTRDFFLTAILCILQIQHVAVSFTL